MSGPHPPTGRRGGTFARILQNAGWLMAGKGVGALLSLVYLGIATRTLGVAGFGQFALILGTAQTLAALVGFQTWQIVIRYGMEHLHAGRRRELADLIGFTLLLDVGGALVGCLIAFVSVTALGDHFDWSREVQRDALIFAIVMLLSVRSTAAGVLRLHDQFRTSAAVDAVMPIVRFAGAIVVLVVGPTLVGFLIAWAAAEVMTALASWIFAARASGRMLSLRGLLQPRRVLRAHPGLATFTISSNISFTLESVTKQFLTVVVGVFAGAVAAGHYRIAYQVGQGIAKLAELLSRAVYSELTRAHFGDERENLPKLFRTSVRFSMLAGAVILAIVLLAGKPALILVAGEAFAPAYPLLVLLGIAAALEFGGVNFQPALLATDRPGLVLNLRLAVTALLLATLLPLQGAWGAAAATAAASLAGLVLFGIAAWMAVHKRA